MCSVFYLFNKIVVFSIYISCIYLYCFDYSLKTKVIIKPNLKTEKLDRFTKSAYFLYS